MQKIADFLTPFNTPSLLSKMPYEKTSIVTNESVHTKACHIETTTSSSFMEKIKHVVEKVKQVALFIIKVTLSALLYWVNPSLFAMGFIAGIIFDEQVRQAINKIEDVWKSQKIAGTLFGGLACTLSMPITIATASLLWSAHLGSLMSAEAQKILKKHPSSGEKTQTPPATGFC